MSFHLKPSGEESGVIRAGKCNILCGPNAVASARDDESIVVIDNLRATSLIVTACAIGVETVHPVVHEEDAFCLREQGAVIAGECDGRKLPGFDIGNSPVELLQRYNEQPFTMLALKTTNFVPLIVQLRRAVICSTLNITAVARFLMNESLTIFAACSSRGASEDFGTALALAALFNGDGIPVRSVSTFTAESFSARHLQSIGYRDDVDFILSVDRYDAVPLYDNGIIQCCGAIRETSG